MRQRKRGREREREGGERVRECVREREIQQYLLQNHVIWVAGLKGERERYRGRESGERGGSERECVGVCEKETSNSP